MQLSLLAEPVEKPVPGFRYHANVISPEEEAALAGWAAALPLKPFEFRGYLGGRRTASFGYRYDYARRVVEEAWSLPDILLKLRHKVASVSGHAPEAFAQALVTEYAGGAPIGWHRDKPQFGDIVGVSLLASARLRFRRPAGDRWERRAQLLQARSCYLLSGEARQSWQHSIPPQETLRYSITFRTLAPGAEPPRRGFA